MKMQLNQPKLLEKYVFGIILQDIFKITLSTAEMKEINTEGCKQQFPKKTTHLRISLPNIWRQQ